LFRSNRLLKGLEREKQAEPILSRSVKEKRSTEGGSNNRRKRWTGYINTDYKLDIRAIADGRLTSRK